MPRFIAKPVVVEAHQWMGTPLPLHFQVALLRNDRDGAVLVSTGDGPRQCRHRDWIVRGSDGLFLVMHDGAFDAAFDPLVQPDKPVERAKRPYVRRIQENA